MHLGSVVSTTIESIAFGGIGIGRIQGMVVFVPYTVTHDQVEVIITEIKNNYVRGEVLTMIAPSPYRVMPLCRYFGACGGCNLQHVNYAYQLQCKQQQVKDISERLGKFRSPLVLDIIPSPEIFHYRSRADFHVEFLGGNVSCIGFIRVSGESVIDIERCEIVEEGINRSYKEFRASILQKDNKEVEERKTIWSRSKEQSQGDPDDPAVGPRVEIMVKGRRMIVPRSGFFQVNGTLVSKLVDQVVELAALTGKEIVVDGYCGAGLFSLFLASNAGQVIGIDIHAASIHCARANLQKIGAQNASFIQGSFGTALKNRLFKHHKAVDVVLLDPPRNGCGTDVLDVVLEMGAKKIIYISCNPPTQARDLRYLVQEGFELISLQPIDMFPQTGHIEVIGLLEAG